MSTPSIGTLLPRRRGMSHSVPSWVAQGVRHFVTINALKRDAAPFAPATVAAALLRNLLAYEAQGRWHLWLAVVMPDHLHFIATFNLDAGLAASVAAWKGYQTRTLKVAFQRNFFEHRLRDDDEYVEKASYVRENPVRKGLVADAAQWPYLYDRSAAADSPHVLAFRTR